MKAGVYAVLALLLVAAFGLWKLLLPDSQEQVLQQAGARVRVAVVERRDIRETIEAIGTTSSWQSIELRPTVTEVVEAIHFSDGQLVRKDDPLLSLRQEEEQARLAEARAFLDEQIREVRRIEGLVARKSLPQNQLDERRTLLEIARARLAATQAALADRNIRAPFDGIMGLVDISPGALVKPETMIGTLDDIAQLKLDFPVPSLQLARLRVGADVTARTPAIADRVFEGKVIGVDSRVNPVDRAVMVRARLDNAALLLRPGMLLNVELGHAERSALVVPEEAILHYQRDHSVLVVDRAAGNRLERREIGIGMRMPGSVEVVSGLHEGEWVVTEGITSAKPGQQVQIADEEGVERAP